MSSSTRKNDEAYVLDITPNILAAVDWHISQGYGGEEFLFSKSSAFPRYIDSHVRPLRLVQEKLGLRLLSHHQVGRHSVASQAVTSGESVKVVQAQLGHRSEQSTHKYAHLGSGAQKRLIETLQPKSAPHEGARGAHVNVGSTRVAKASSSDLHVNLRSTALVANTNAVAQQKRKAPVFTGAFLQLRGGAMPAGYRDIVGV